MALTQVPSVMIERPLVTIASASTVNIGAAASDNISVTGTTTITAFDNVAAGTVRTITFAGALTLTYNATTLILPGAASITTAAGDVATFISLGSGNWRCTSYNKANGQAVVAPAGGVTSAVAGNGIAVSAATGAVTFSAAAPTFNSIGSYVFGTLGTSAATAGTTYSAGGSNGQVRTAAIFYDCSGVMQINAQNTLSGTWRAMGGNVASPFGTMSLFCRTA